MKKRLTALTVAASAVLTTLVLASPADAATLYARCNTTGASGGVTVYDFYGATDKVSLFMGIDDTKADGAHARIRLMTKNHAGHVRYWPWHANTKGAGTSLEWKTTAKDDSGIFDVGVQVARFKGDTLKNSCKAWSYAR